MLERYGHGGDLVTARELYGLEADRFVDFSANMNPLGPPACVAELLRSYADIIGRYPDPAVRRLRQKLALRHGVDESCIVVGNGAAELIELAVRLAEPEVTVVTAPSFAEYGDAARKAGTRLTSVKLAAEEGFRHTMEGTMRSLRSLREEGIRKGGSLWFIGSPNNPTGRLCDPDVIHALLDEGERVVVDEAFMDFIPEADRWSVLHDAAEHTRLIVIRSMTKFYAIPGIRLGYSVAAPEVSQQLQSLQVPWSVNSLAQQIGEAVLDDEDYRLRTLHWLAEERPWLTAELAKLGLIVTDGSANYILFSIPDRFGLSSPELQRALGEKGVLIRNAALFEGLDERYCRAAVRLREDNIRLLDGLHAVLGTQV
jgi:threonine-phosphate decarboxylase